MQMKSFLQYAAILISLCCSACMNQKQYLKYSGWDKDDDRRLERAEFTQAYVNSGYFTKWSPDGGPISYEEFYQLMYNAVDDDSSRTIKPDEFYRQLESFALQGFTEHFRVWDNDRNGVLTEKEFNQKIAQTAFACQWDSNNDNVLSVAEMGTGMFYRCDLNDNGWIDPDEFDYWRYFR